MPRTACCNRELRVKFSFHFHPETALTPPPHPSDSTPSPPNDLDQQADHTKGGPWTPVVLRGIQPAP